MFNKSIFFKIFVYKMFFVLTLSSATSSLADDTEIFFAPPGASQVVKPNIMFLIDNSGSMSETGGGDKSRLQVVKDVTNSLIDDMSGVNVGLATFNIEEDVDCPWYGTCWAKYRGSKILSPPMDVDVQANVNSLKLTVNDLQAGGSTPMAEALTEVGRYFKGETPYYDFDPIDEVMNGEVYDSPVKYQCQKNYVVFLTDGEPQSDDSDSFISDYIGEKCGTESSGDENDNCLDEVAGYLSSGDLFNNLEGRQFVTTSTVGFHTNQQLLSDTADSGGGSYYLASDESGLSAAFDDFYQAVRAQGTTYVSPGVAVNTFDRLNHLNTLYYALFQSDLGAIWNGNLKRYKLEVREGADGQERAVVVDVNGNEAIDDTTGFFKDSAKSWWSPVVDGPNVGLGGAASQLSDDVPTRNVFSNLASNRSDLSDTQNQLLENNNNLTKSDFGMPGMSDDDFQKLVRWTRGVDVNDDDGDQSTSDSRKFLADPLHSVPQLVIYSADQDVNQQDTTVFYGDNQGFIHAIDGNSGGSYFSFIPRELLDNQSALMNSTDASDKVYGMDGSVVKWSYDAENDGEIGSSSEDFVRIFSGMRRGGKSYYALDVTDRTSPELMWSITGGVDGSDYEELAQSWSTPVKAKFADGTDVLVFGGGYDEQQDDVNVRTEDSEGRALFIADAETGERLWWAGPKGSGADLELSSMNYSIPASPKVLDINGDGLFDQIYVGDMGGQIFRFDVVVTQTNNKKSEIAITGGRIANLSSSQSGLNETEEESNRRFYHSPDLFGIKIGARRELGLVIGSGYQAHPLDTDVKDRLYMLRIPDVSAPPIDPDDPNEERVDYGEPITEDDLYDATDNLIQDGESEEVRGDEAAKLAGSKGWFIRLDNPGEKVLSESTTVNNEIFFTTYEPKASDDPCLPATGTSRLYHVSAFNGVAVRNYDGLGSDDELTRQDRYMTLSTAGLPPSAQRMRVDDTDVICVGTECETIDTVQGVVETYWYED
ncbi:type IV pilus assembly protein PilY1 [Marinobacter persicus]|uniref:Type IV pilus assembly protein PilY1 n=1 Tax=Marinobacter persicus TaxID=930118 RepID=A0A1I3X337_9GAMM|nr:PilC/PilY family type IV pilus protein [Marinobacter persicus]GHD48521.1 hypothetical protein GCM10008110_17370 [Marinobacter persicus]SFK14013.1 type IV pilus assembly protein PilY1 [Marinobacter persicus]